MGENNKRCDVEVTRESFFFRLVGRENPFWERTEVSSTVRCRRVEKVGSGVVRTECEWN